MQTPTALRIRIEDLPPLEQLSPEELARIFGAGRQQFARLGIESLEARELMTAGLALTPPLSSPNSIVFVDSSVDGYQRLLSGVSGEVVVLTPGTDGVQQIANALNGRSGVEAISVVSHGAMGGVYVGDAVLNTQSAEGKHAEALHAIAQALTPGADLLLYGCQVGAGEVGQAFLSKLAIATGADVAASTNLTGAASQGGDWQLEAATGQIEHGLPIATDVAAEYDGALFNVIKAVTGGGGGISIPNLSGLNPAQAAQNLVNMAPAQMGAALKALDPVKAGQALSAIADPALVAQGLSEMASSGWATAARALEQMDPAKVGVTLTQFDPNRAALLLNEMAPDRALAALRSVTMPAYNAGLYAATMLSSKAGALVTQFPAQMGPVLNAMNSFDAERVLSWVADPAIASQALWAMTPSGWASAARVFDQMAPSRVGIILIQYDPVRAANALSAMDPGKAASALRSSTMPSYNAGLYLATMAAAKAGSIVDRMTPLAAAQTLVAIPEWSDVADVVERMDLGKAADALEKMTSRGHLAAALDQIATSTMVAVVGKMNPEVIADAFAPLSSAVKADMLDRLTDSLAADVLDKLSSANAGGALAKMKDAGGALAKMGSAQVAKLDPGIVADILGPLSNTVTAGVLDNLPSADAADVLDKLSAANAGGALAKMGDAAGGALAQMDPAKIAAVIGSLGTAKAGELLATFSPTTVASKIGGLSPTSAGQVLDALRSGSVPKFTTVLAGLTPERAYDILATYAPATRNAALSVLSAERAGQVLSKFDEATITSVFNNLPTDRAAQMINTNWDRLNPVLDLMLPGQLGRVVTNFTKAQVVLAVQNLNPTRGLNVLNALEEQYTILEQTATTTPAAARADAQTAARDAKEKLEAGKKTLLSAFQDLKNAAMPDVLEKTLTQFAAVTTNLVQLPFEALTSFADSLTALSGMSWAGLAAPTGSGITLPASNPFNAINADAFTNVGDLINFNTAINFVDLGLKIQERSGRWTVSGEFGQYSFELVWKTFSAVDLRVKEWSVTAGYKPVPILKVTGTVSDTQREGVVGLQLDLGSLMIDTSMSLAKLPEVLPVSITFTPGRSAATAKRAGIAPDSGVTVVASGSLEFSTATYTLNSISLQGFSNLGAGWQSSATVTAYHNPLSSNYRDADAWAYAVQVAVGLEEFRLAVNADPQKGEVTSIDVDLTITTSNDPKHPGNLEVAQLVAEILVPRLWDLTFNGGHDTATAVVLGLEEVYSRGIALPDELKASIVEVFTRETKTTNPPKVDTPNEVPPSEHVPTAAELEAAQARREAWEQEQKQLIIESAVRQMMAPPRRAR